MRRRLVAPLAIPFAVVVMFAATALGQGDEGGIAAEYNVKLRYRIDAPRVQRYPLYKKFVARLAAAGFKKNPGLEGEELFGEEMTGTIPSGGIPALLRDPYLRTAILTPTMFERSGEGNAPVLVRLYLSSILGPGRQAQVADLARQMLKPLEFQEAPGHDHEHHRRLLGHMPMSQLDQLLKPSQEFDVPPLPGVAPHGERAALVKLALVIPEPNAPTLEKEAAPERPAGLRPADKIAPDLKLALAGLSEEAQATPMRLELALRGRDAAVPGGFRVDGRLGNLVFGEAPPAAVAALVDAADVSTVRLPQVARSFGPAGFDIIPLEKPLGTLTGLGDDLRRRTSGKAVVIASDFTGYEALVGTELPQATRLLDFTGETNPQMQTRAEDMAGQGVALAKALLKKTGAKELLLVRIDPTLPYQVEQVARATHGMGWRTPALQRREHDIEVAYDRLNAERFNLRVARRIAQNTFGNDEDAKVVRDNFRKLQAEFDAAEKAAGELKARYLTFLNDVAAIKNAASVLVGLSWPDGQADLPGQPLVLRGLSPELLRHVTWYQAVPRREGQTWSGLFRDGDGDGRLEYRLDGERADLNFLAWRTADGKLEANLPAGAVIQLNLQWREVHSADLKDGVEDLYRQPLAPLKVVVLKQRDPAGKQLPKDLFDLVVRSTALPDRVENDGRSAVYQTITRFTVPEGGGRFAVMIEGQAPQSTLPPGTPALRNERGELIPKLVADVVDPIHRPQGSVILETPTVD